ncbi:MAG TPA: hypothetical protein VIC71_12785 [Gammaproteobacteria bacterium]|jgi:hypothetical protein
MARYKNELILFGGLLGFGLILLPFVVYFVGVEIVGPYAGEGGALGLLASIVAAGASGNWAAWILVLSPYLIVQLTRFALRALRRSNRVTPVTD